MGNRITLEDAVEPNRAAHRERDCQIVHSRCQGLDPDVHSSLCAQYTGCGSLLRGRSTRCFLTVLGVWLWAVSVAVFCFTQELSG